MGKIIGIDLGTTYSCVAVMEGGKATVVTNAEGSRTTPSVVAFTKTGERLVGQVAKRQAVTNPENTIYSIKRFIGRRWDETAEERGRCPYKTIPGKDEMVDVEVAGQRHTPQELSAFILQKLKADAEAYLGEPVTDAIITCPAYFNDSQRQATKDAGTIAGLNVRRIINEPTASALAYGLERMEDQTILVFDLGGGTFDVSILEMSEGVFEVKATHGNNHLGGDDFDQRIIVWMIDEFKKTNGIDLSKDRMALQRLKETAEKTKIELSSAQESLISLPFITADASGPKHLEMTLTRGKFDEITADLVDATMGPTRAAMEDAGLTPDQIHKIILVGGCTRVPAVQRAIKQYLAKDPDKSVNPDEAVAVGAALQGGVLAGEVRDVLLLDVAPLSLGIETLGGVFASVIERNTPIPTKKSQIFSTATDGQTSVEIHVAQGDREMIADNKSLGKFILSGIPPAPRGVPQIIVTFEVDANGIVHVSAKDAATGNEQKIAITGTGGLSKEEVEKMRRDAETHAEADRQRREMIEARNQAESAVHQAEKTIKDFSAKITPERIKLLEEHAAAVKAALQGDDSQKVEQTTTALTQLIYETTSAIYAGAWGGAAPTPAGASSGGDDEIVDADVG